MFVAGFHEGSCRIETRQERAFPWLVRVLACTISQRQRAISTLTQPTLRVKLTLSRAVPEPGTSAILTNHCEKGPNALSYPSAGGGPRTKAGVEAVARRSSDGSRWRDPRPGAR